MPNSRAPNQKQLTFWLKKSKLKSVEDVAAQKGMTKTEFARYAIELALALEAEKNKKDENGKNNDKR